MFFPTLLMPVALAALFAVHDVYSSPLMSRQTLDCSPGGVAQPAADTSVSDGDIIPFDFVEGFTNQCHPPYTPISVWLLAAQPTFSSLNANHEFDDFLFHFGDYTINHFPRESSLCSNKHREIYLCIFSQPAANGYTSAIEPERSRSRS